MIPTPPQVHLVVATASPEVTKVPQRLALTAVMVAVVAGEFVAPALATVSV